MKSMTGYGRGESAQDGFKVTVELSSVNRKQSEIVVYLPRELEALEARVRDLLNQSIGRGRLTVKVSLHAGENSYRGRVQMNLALAKAYAKEMRKLARELELPDSLNLDLLLRAPGVMETDQELTDADDFWPAIEKSLRQAVAALVKMREREGVHLAKDLHRRMGVIQKSASRIQAAAPEMVERYREQLRERIQKAGLELPAPDDERIVKEVIYFADRSDVSEELTRLQSHFKQFEDCVKSKEPIGRTLDFLAQELNREINTIGSKAMDSRISREVVIMKTELEKFREQVQNVE